MGEEQESQENKDQKAREDKILSLINLLRSTYGLSVKDISKTIKVPGYDALIDYSNGKFPKNKPEFLDAKIEELEALVRSEKLKKMEKLENSPATYLNPTVTQYPGVEELINVSVQKAWVCLYFSTEIDPEPYYGETEVIGYPTKKNGKDAIIVEPNDSKKFKEAEGVVPSYDPATVGYEIAIKRIKLINCAWGRRYYLWDIYKHAYLVRLYKDKDNYYRLVYNDPERFPDKMLQEHEIAVVFKVTALFVPE